MTRKQVLAILLWLHCGLSQVLMPGIAKNKSSGAVTIGVTEICLNCLPNTDIKYDQKFNPSVSVGYYPSKCETWEKGGSTHKVSITYKSASGPDIIHYWGALNNDEDDYRTVSITQPIKGISVWMKDAEQGAGTAHTLDGFYFYTIDGTVLQCGSNVDTTEYEFYRDVQLGLCGMYCSFRVGSVGTDRGLGCKPYVETCLSPDKQFDAKTINDMTFTLAVPANSATTQDVNFTQSNGRVGCGPRTYTFSPNYTFLTHTGSAADSFMTGNLLNLSTTDPTTEGPHAVALTVTLTLYPTITVTKNFTVTIICVVNTMSFVQTSPITSIFILGIDTDPMNIAYSVTKNPSCVSSPAFTISPSLSFITNSPSGNGGNILVSGVTPSDTNRPTGSKLYTLTLTATQNVSASITVNLTLKCGITAITVSQSPLDASYILNDPDLVTLSLDVVQTQDCQYPFTYTHTVTKTGTGIIPMPGWLTFDASGTRKFTIAATLPADVGTYVVQTVSSITNIAGVTRVTSVTSSFNLIIVHDCTTTSLTSRVLNDMSATVSVLDDSQSIFFADQVAFGHSNPTYCGARTYTLAPNYSFLTISGDTLNLSSTSPLEVNTYNLLLTISLTDWVSIPSIQVGFKVTIICLVQNLAFAPITSQVVTVGITVQPFQIPFSTTKTPNCAQNPTFTMTPNTPINFVTLSPSGAGGSNDVNAVQANHGTYTLTLDAVVDGKSAQATISLQIIDPCSYATIVTIPATVPDLVIVMFSAGTTTNQQSFVISTNHEQASIPVVCTESATLTPSANYISLSADFQTVTVDETQIVLPTDVGIHKFNIAIVNTVFPAVNLPLLPITVNITCNVMSLSVTSKPVNETHILNEGVKQTLPFSLDLVNDCKYSLSYTHAWNKNGNILAAKPAWLSFNDATTKYTMTLTDPNDVGVYDFTVTGSVTNPATMQITSVSETFTITVLSDCVLTSIDDSSVNNMVARVSQQEAVQTVEYGDEIAKSHTSPDYCGARVFQITPTFNFFSYSADGVYVIMTLKSTNPAEEGYYDAQIKVSLADYPGIPSIVKQFQLHIECEILVADATIVPLSMLQRIMIEEPKSQQFQFAVFPACQIQYTLTPEVDYIQLNTGTKSIVLDSKNQNDKGVNFFWVGVKPAYPSFGVSTSRQFKVTLIDPCDEAVIIDQKIENIEVTKQSDAYNNAQVLQWNSFRYNPLEQYKVDCGKLKTEFFLQGTKDKPPSWIRPGEQLLEVSFNMAPQPMIVPLTMVVSLEEKPSIKLQKNLNVTLSSFEFECLLNPTQKYNVGSPPFSFMLSFKETQIGDASKVHRLQEITVIDKYGQDINPPPKFLTFQPDGYKFTITSNDDIEPGQFLIGLKLGYLEFPSYFKFCLKQVNIAYDPTFNGPPILDQTILISNDWSYTVPKYTDGFGLLAKSELDLGGAEEFIKYDEASGNLKISVSDVALLTHVGDYAAKLTLTDKRGSTKEIKFKIILKQFQKDKPSENAAASIKVYPPPKPFIKSLNQYGLIRIGFSRSILLPTFDLYPEFKTAENMNPCTNGVGGGSGKCLRRQLQSEDAVKQAVDIVNSGLVVVNNTVYPIVEIKVLPGDDSDPNLLGFNWTCTDIRENYMDIKILYGKPDVVSYHESKEKIKIDFIGRKYFPAKDDGQLFQEGERLVSRTLPLQMDAERGEKLSIAGQLIGNAGKATVAANLAFNFLLGGALSELFAAINKLQIMVHLLVINVQIPANAQIYFSVLLQLVTFNFIDTEDTMREMFGLFDEEELNPNFYYLGYHSMFFLINIGNLLIGLLYNIGCLLFILLTTCIENKKIVAWRNDLKKSMLWNSVLSFFQETLLIFAISCCLQFSSHSFKTFGLGFTSELSLIFGIMVFGFPVISCFLLFRNKYNLTNEANKGVFGTLYENLIFNRPTFAMLSEPAVCQVRLLVMAIAFVFMQDHPFFQIFFNIFLTIFFVIFTVGQEVYSNRAYFYFQYFNEFFILVIIYHMMVFAEVVADVNTQEIMGWSAIVTLTFNMFVNFSYIIASSCKEKIKQIRYRCLIRKRDRMRKELKEREEEDRKEEEKQWNLYLAQRQKIEAYMKRVQEVLEQQQKPLPQHKRLVSIDHKVVMQTKEPEIQSFHSFSYDEWMPQRHEYDECKPPLQIEEEEPAPVEPVQPEEVKESIEAKLKATAFNQQVNEEISAYQQMARDLVERSKRRFETQQSTTLLTRPMEQTQSTLLARPIEQTQSTLLASFEDPMQQSSQPKPDNIDNKPYRNKFIQELDLIIEELKKAQADAANRQTMQAEPKPFMKQESSPQNQMSIWEDDDECAQSSNHYVQNTEELADQLNQSQRVMRRRQTINNFAVSSQTTGEQFNSLWRRN